MCKWYAFDCTIIKNEMKFIVKIVTTKNIKYDILVFGILLVLQIKCS